VLVCALLALTLTATAAAERISTSKLPVTAVLASPCSPDVITFTGTLVLTVTESDSAKVSLSGTVQDPHAVGVFHSYNFKDQLGSADLVKVGDRYSAKFTDRLHFIRLGSGVDQQSDDLFVTVVVYATIDSNLVVTPDRVDYLVDCK
jgi:hypothetical protein